MHKALEILKNQMAIISANENHVYSKKQIYQVIVELEEAMKPKSGRNIKECMDYLNLEAT